MGLVSFFEIPNTFPLRGESVSWFIANGTFGIIGTTRSLAMPEITFFRIIIRN